MLKEYEYQESIISKIYERTTKDHSLSQQQLQDLDIQEMMIETSPNLPYVKGASEKLQRILISHKVRSVFHTENTLGRLQCERKDRLATEDKKQYCL